MDVAGRNGKAGTPADKSIGPCFPWRPLDIESFRTERVCQRTRVQGIDAEDHLGRVFAVVVAEDGINRDALSIDQGGQPRQLSRVITQPDREPSRRPGKSCQADDRVEQIGAGYDPDELVSFHDGKAAYLSGEHDPCGFLHRVEGRRRDRVPRHDLFDERVGREWRRVEGARGEAKVPVGYDSSKLSAGKNRQMANAV